MNRYRKSIRIGLPLAAMVGVMSIGFSLPLGYSQSPAAPAQKPPLAKIEEAVQTDTTSCVTCHNHPSADGANGHPFSAKFNSDKYILLNEGKTWKTEDPHSRAYSVLTEAPAEAMGKRLGYDVAKSAACLACHASDKAPTIPADPKRFDPVRFDVTSGVGCTACHGVEKTWQTKHFQAKDDKIEWRELTVGEKKGMRDLRNPKVKAELCVSCHVGNPAEGKVISHAMYAAGHPPLPPFELASYLSGEPQHWKHPTELGYFVNGKWADQERWERFHYHPADKESSAARNFAAGAVAALKAEAELILHEAKKAMPEKDKYKDSVDFARFDCYSCHHDLKPNSDRQKRGYKAAPGRPTLRASIIRSAELIVEHAKESKVKDFSSAAAEFASIWKDLHVASTGNPYGDPEKMVVAAQAIISWCVKFITILGDSASPIYSPFNKVMPSETVRLLELLAKEIGSKDNPMIADPEVALVLSWAYSRIADDLKVAPTDQKLSMLFGIRREPFVGKNTTPVWPARLDLKARSVWIKDFAADDFRDNFWKLHPPK